jgi:hypothetical protein
VVVVVVVVQISLYHVNICNLMVCINTYICEGEYLRNAEGDEVTQGHRHTDTVQVNVRPAGVILGLELSCYDFMMCRICALYVRTRMRTC